MITLFDNHEFDLDEVIASIKAGRSLPKEVSDSINGIILEHPDYAAHFQNFNYSGEDLERVRERAALIKMFRHDKNRNNGVALALDPSGIFLLEGSFNSPSFYDLSHTPNGKEGLLSNEEYYAPYRWFQNRISISGGGFDIGRNLQIERVASPETTGFLFNEYIKDGNPWVIVYGSKNKK